MIEVHLIWSTNLQIYVTIDIKTVSPKSAVFNVKSNICILTKINFI